MTIITTIATILASLAGAEVDSGWTSHYAEYVMDWQVEYHDLTPPCSGCAIAVSDCSLIGDVWFIRPVGSDAAFTPVVIADCAGQDALNEDGVSWMDEYGVIAELSYELADEFDCINSSIEIEVIKGVMP